MDSGVVSGSDWAELPKHLFDMVLEKLVTFSDFARFSAVCVPWYRVAMDNREKFAMKINRQVPMLLFPKKCEEKGETKCLYDITQKKVVNLELRVPYSTRYGGSSRGWLIIVGEDYVVTLINPISPRKVISLPPILKDEFDYKFQIQKAILSADPTIEPYDYEVAAVYGTQGQLAIIKPGRKAADWNYIYNIDTVFYDIIYHKGRLHAVNYKGDAFCLDENMSIPRELSPSPTGLDTIKTYLVESLEGDLLLVIRYMEKIDTPLHHKTVDFEVYKLNTRGRVWLELESLGSETLFLGDSMSMSMLASEIPGCSPNSIYFTHDYDDDIGLGHCGPLDSGVFYLENSSIAPHYVADETSLLAMTEQPPIWYMPTFLSIEPFRLNNCGC